MVVPITKRMEIIMNIQVYHISQMIINYKENGGRKSFSSKSEAHISQCAEHDVVPINKNN